MKIKHIDGERKLETFIIKKLNRFTSSEKTFSSLFEFMFEQADNVMVETSKGFKINRCTYGECKQKAILIGQHLKAKLLNQEGKVVGLYMDNGEEWIETFWAILMCGCNPLLINSRLPDEVVLKALCETDAAWVVSSGKDFGVKTLTLEDILGGETSPFTSWGGEVLFMSSGTTSNVKLCAYNAENFYYQVLDSLNIVKSFPQIKSNYKGEIKLLALLPFYHVFGFTVVYLWFGFFARTFVFLNDLSPQTLLRTVKRHEVTHFFAVPMVFDKVYKQAIKAIRARGEKTYNKFVKASKFVSKNQVLGNVVSKYAFQQIRDKIFGDSIRVMISGGSAPNGDTISFLNAIGYFTVNGYGMTEIGITSVDTSPRRKERNLCSIGKPFSFTEYKVENGQLFVKSKTRAYKIISNGNQTVCDFNDWFATCDLALEKDGKYYLLGRNDDLIITSSGENINPEFVERTIKIDGVDSCCLVKGENDEPTLIVKLNGWVNVEKLRRIEQTVKRQLQNVKSGAEVKKIIITSSPLVDENDFKVSRTKISKWLKTGKIQAISLENKTAKEELTELESALINLFKEVLDNNDVQIEPDSNFFNDLNGSSLDYLLLVNKIRDDYNLGQDDFKQETFTTVKQFAEFIIKKNG